MIRKTFVVAAVAGLLAASPGQAAIYYLTQTNLNPIGWADLDSGPGYYAKVEIADIGGDITFTVTPNGSMFSPIVGAFGIQHFAFNDRTNDPGDSPLPDGATNPPWDLPTNWTAQVAPPPNSADGFGMFDVILGTNMAANRVNPLSFSIVVASDNINTYFAESTDSVTEGNAWFAVHIAGFSTGDYKIDADPSLATCDPGSANCYEVTSGWFGGATNGGGEPPTSIVPEPLSAALVGTALLGLVAIRRKMV